MLAAITPLVVLAVLLLAWGEREHESAVERGLRDTARALGIAVDEQILSWRAALEALATSPAFKTGDFAMFYDQAVAVAAQHSAGIVVFDESFAQLLNTRVPYGQALPAAAYPEPLRRVFASGEPLIAGPFVGVVAKHWLVSLDVPVKRDERVAYSINLSIHPDRIGDVLKRQGLAHGWVVHIVNAEGNFVTRTEGATDVIGRAVPAWYADAIGTGAAGIIEGPSPAGGPEQILAFQPLGEAPWTLALAIPEANLDAVWERPIWLFGSLALLAIAAALLLGWLFSRRMTRPLESLSEAAADVLAGRESGLSPLAIPEFERLRQVLAQSAAAARERIAAEERAAAAEAVAEEMRQSEERQRLLAREVDHRAKNVLAVAQSILALTRAKDIAGYKEAVRGRIMALARSHSLIAASHWRGANLWQIVQDELAPHPASEATTPGHSRVKAVGPDVTLSPAAAQSIAIAIHELVTNAVKYGALSRSNGELSVDWRVTEEGLQLNWDEKGGPPVPGPPEHAGFGTSVVAATIEHQLDGHIDFHWRAEGLLVQIQVPSGQLIAEDTEVQRDRAEAPNAGHAGDAAVLSGRRVLVVEDEALVASQVAGLLVTQGCAVVGPISGVDEALASICAEPLDAAILDANLSGTPSDPVATALAERGVPFIVLTGYADSGLSDAFRGARVVAKPFDEDALVSSLASTISDAPPDQAVPAGRED